MARALQLDGAQPVMEIAASTAIVNPRHHDLWLAQVFARTAPEQKELILRTLRAAGKTTLMCGDGTNDVGALKAAHVGVAVLAARPGLPPVPGAPGAAGAAGAPGQVSTPN